MIDASALGAIVFQEPHAESVREQIEGTAVFAPPLLKFELANTAWTKARRQPADAAKIVNSLAAQACGITAYDASYLWLAGSLGADLVTLDRRLALATEAVSVL